MTDKSFEIGPDLRAQIHARYREMTAQYRARTLLEKIADRAEGEFVASARDIGEVCNLIDKSGLDDEEIRDGVQSIRNVVKAIPGVNKTAQKILLRSARDMAGYCLQRFPELPTD